MNHHHKLHLREAPALERRDAAPRPSSWNADARTIDMRRGDGIAVPRQDARGQAFEEILAITQEAVDLGGFAGAHVLNGHAQGSVENIIGTVERAWIEGEQFWPRCAFRRGPRSLASSAILLAASSGALSVGYEVETWADGEANGKRTQTATRWRPREHQLRLRRRRPARTDTRPTTASLRCAIEASASLAPVAA